jgi:hypothetical protein
VTRAYGVDLLLGEPTDGADGGDCGGHGLSGFRDLLPVQV